MPKDRSRSRSRTSKRKRSHSDSPENNDYESTGVDPKLISKWETAFTQDPVNIIAKNTVGTMGSYFSSMDPTEVRKVTHIFLNTLKRHHLKATNQGQSGRCWLFAGLNTFRHLMIQAMGLENFEFSETYLFFWDKLERSNYFLQWFIDHPYEIGSREVNYMLKEYRGDGGYWDMFANLVNKYGLVPQSAMPETYQSSDSGDMNDILDTTQNACVNWIFQHRLLDADGQLLNRKQLESKKQKVVHQMYDILVKFLGQPPNDFNWFYENCDAETHEHLGQVVKLNPTLFTQLILPKETLNVNDFVMLSHYPTNLCQYNQMYQIKWTSNMVGGQEVKFLNLPISQLKKYAIKSINKNLPVWFGGDVNRGLDMYHSALNMNIFNHELLFGETLKITKGQRVEIGDSDACHAMVLIGVNLDENGKSTEWQVENSWGYLDAAEPGLDGFLSMTDEWFDECLFLIVIHKNFLSKKHQDLVNHTQPIIINPWDSMAPAVKTQPNHVPHKYLEKLAYMSNHKN